MISHSKIQSLITKQNNFVTWSLEKISSDNLNRISQAVIDISNCKGIVYFTGVGKNGHVASLASSTFASLGINCSFLNPVEAVHGDMGVVSEKDILFAVSKSGTTLELINFLDHISEKFPNISIYLLTSNSELEYNKLKTVVIPTVKELIYDIVPTTSILNYINVLQVIALLVATEKNLNIINFKSNHPGGAIGQTLKDK